MSEYLKKSYNILYKIFRDKTYTTEALYKTLENDEDSDIVYRIVLGTLERNVELQFILDELCDKPPKTPIAVILKMGIYCLKYMDSLPDYAVVDNSVELTKKLGKVGVSGFVNAVLKKVIRGEYKLPTDNGLEGLSVKYSVPAWIIEKIRKEYGDDTMLKILSAKSTPTHLRVNHKMMSDKDFESLMAKNKEKFTKTDLGYYVAVSPLIKKLFIEGRITYQSLTSMLAVKTLAVEDGQKVLDVCSAPGGKAVLIAENNPHSEVIACDIHPHRVELIGAYARRMHITNVFEKCVDGTVFNPEFLGMFDRVLVDAPCSAIGVMKKQPDIMLNRTPNDIKELKKTQLAILENASMYVKKGGILVYSTCTIFKEENDDNINAFLKSHKDFEDYPCETTKQYLPDGTHDGFYVRRLILK